MRSFRLVRTEDVSGVSGTGAVAEGVEWTNGKVTICWLGTFGTISVLDNLHQLEHLHGHEGKTTVVWNERQAS